MPDLSVIIPARQEQWVSQTVQDLLAHAAGDIEVIVVLDGAGANPPVPDHPKVTTVYHAMSRGQRAGINEGLALARSPYVMKIDAHCAVDQGFDVKLLTPYLDGTFDQSVTTLPGLYSLHAFDWVCDGCGRRSMQGPKPTACATCQGVPHHQLTVWTPANTHRYDFGCFDAQPHFQYWMEYSRRPAATQPLVEVMSFGGGCWVIPTARFRAYGGMDEAYGPWGSTGIEIACKTWLSGGRLVLNRQVAYGHLFRTKSPGFSFPYPLSGKAVAAAKARARDIWFGNKWSGQTRPLAWLLDAFWPVPGWTEADRTLVQHGALPAAGVEAA